MNAEAVVVADVVDGDVDVVNGVVVVDVVVCGSDVVCVVVFAIDIDAVVGPIVCIGCDVFVLTFDVIQRIS